MASDSQTATVTTSEKPLENKEASLMEKEIVLEETADSNLTVTKEEEKSVQPPAVEPEKEPSAEVEEVAAVVKAEESTENGKDEKKVDEQVELKEPNLVKEGVAEVNDQAVDVEEAEGKGKDENGEEKVVKPVELKEPTLVKESVEEVVNVEKADEKLAVESVAEEHNKDKEDEKEKKMVDVSESTDEAGGKHVEPVDVPLVREVSAETVAVEVFEVEPKPKTSEQVETQPEKAKELAPEVEIVRTEETPETAEQTEEKQVVEEPSKDEKEKVSEEAPTANGKSGETLEKTDTESTEGNKQEGSVTEKVAEVVEAVTVAKEIDETKQEPEVTSKEVKHSRSIISKVKQSLVKAKKAIIGKSPSSKTITTEETKEEIIAK